MGVRGFIMFCQSVRGSQNFFYLLLCVGGVRLSTLPPVKKIIDPLLLINDWSL